MQKVFHFAVCNKRAETFFLKKSLHKEDIP